MAAPDFPASPTIGQTYTASSGVIYTWDGAVWSTSAGVAAAYWTDTGTALTPTNAGRMLQLPGDTTSGAQELLGPTTGTARTRIQHHPTVNSQMVFGLNRNWVGGNILDDSTKPAWAIRFAVDATDNFVIQRTAPGTTSPSIFLAIDGVGKTTCTLADGTVNRAMLAAGAATAPSVPSGSIPASFTTTVYDNWVTVTTNSITTRGGLVVIVVQGLTYNSISSGQINLHQRLLRDGASITLGSVQPGNRFGITGIIPIPGTTFVDQPAAGAHTYTYQVYQGTGASSSITAFGGTNNLFYAFEIS